MKPPQSIEKIVWTLICITTASLDDFIVVTRWTKQSHLNEQEAIFSKRKTGTNKATNNKNVPIGNDLFWTSRIIKGNATEYDKIRKTTKFTFVRITEKKYVWGPRAFCKINKKRSQRKRTVCRNFIGIFIRWLWFQKHLEPKSRKFEIVICHFFWLSRLLNFACYKKKLIFLWQTKNSRQKIYELSDRSFVWETTWKQICQFSCCFMLSRKKSRRFTFCKFCVKRQWRVQTSW